MSLAYSVCWHIFLYWMLMTVSHGNEPRTNGACECLPDRTECCEDVFRHLMHDYGRKQYKVYRYTSWAMLTVRRRTKSLPRFYLCEREGCKFYNLGEKYSGNKRINDNEADTTGEERRKRGIVDLCCEVETKVVQLLTVIDINDETNVRDVLLDANNTAPTFVTRYCKEPNSDCGDDQGVCITVQDIHSVLVQQYSNSSNTTEYSFVPVIFDVGCECQSKPNK